MRRTTRWAERPARAQRDERGGLFRSGGACSQDFGPSLPDSVVTFAERGNRGFLVLSPQRVPIQPIPACVREWDAIERRSALMRQAQAIVDRLAP